MARSAEIEGRVPVPIDGKDVQNTREQPDELAVHLHFTRGTIGQVGNNNL